MAEKDVIRKPVSLFEVFTRMADTDDKKLMLAPLTNITQARAVKAGTNITIGFPGNVCGQIMNDDFIGGLLLCDRKHFNEIREAMEKERR